MACLFVLEAESHIGQLAALKFLLQWYSFSILILVPKGTSFGKRGGYPYPELGGRGICLQCLLNMQAKSTKLDYFSNNLSRNNLVQQVLVNKV